MFGSQPSNRRGISRRGFLRAASVLAVLVAVGGALASGQSLAGWGNAEAADTAAELEIVPQPYLDLDGDGRAEIAYSLRYDQPGRQGWWVEVRSAETNRLIKEIPYARLRAIFDLDGDGIGELVLEREETAASAVATPCPCAQKPGLSFVSQLATGVLASPPITTILKLGSGVETRLGYYELAQDLCPRPRPGETSVPQGGRMRPWLAEADTDADGRPELIGVNRYTGKWTSLGLGRDGAAEIAELPGACRQAVSIGSGEACEIGPSPSHMGRKERAAADRWGTPGYLQQWCVNSGLRVSTRPLEESHEPTTFHSSFVP